MCSDTFHANEGCAVQSCNEETGVITCDLCDADVTSLALGDSLPTCHHCKAPITGKYGDVCLLCAINPPKD